MVSETAESHYYTVKFQATPVSDLWLEAANNHRRELAEDEARAIVDRCENLGLGCKVYLHCKVETTQLVM